ncbi:MAG: histidine kinase dimerization/phosphoacceptor domain -containing protein [Reichenbachiella sp.]|uniref:histidine kinase dimerization/phosphoacceptor domain -containing protein n=1 Tax=Reichenbachiella sp. TaxID=2184521 RepID=UPI0029667BC2|nr:histidine kinase dimerization/phosphoacceptor domain -containing protein [Reichenbachiella sp.]MDW3209987.1 histidine kinase dimerization/phosphoacceptor domain -containing protein [Reichenbachiella sp.]
MTLALLFFSWLLIAPAPESIISIEISEGQLDAIPDFDTTSDEIKFRQAYWAKVVVEVEYEGDYVLSGGKKYLRNMTFFDASKTKIGTGNSLEVRLNKGRSTQYIFYPFLDPKDEKVSIKLTPAAEYYKSAQAEQMMKTGFLVIVFFLFVLSLAFYIVSRRAEIIYLEYALYLFSVFYFFAYQYGFFGYYFNWVNHIHPSLIWITSASITVTYIAFIQSFLHLKMTDPVLQKVLNYGMGFVAFIVLVESVSFIFYFDVQHSIYFTSFSLIVQLSAMSFCLYRIYKIKSVLSKIALFGAAILVSTTLFGQLASTLKLVDQTNYFVMAALTMEIFIFNVGIGIRMALTNKEREKAQSLLIDQMRVTEQIQKDQKEKLEVAVSERTEELAEKNKQNEMLLAEIHHRVKNNLQTISSFLSIQQRKLKDQSSKQAIIDSKNRVIAMGLIHEHLYKNASYAEIDFASYLKELVQNLVNISTALDQKIELSLNISKLQLEVENAILLGLIVNELVNNCLKHAFTDVSEPKLTISFITSNQQTILSVKDNGVGKVEDLKSSDSFGWKIIQALGERLKAKIEVGQREGLQVEIKLDPEYVKTD